MRVFDIYDSTRKKACQESEFDIDFQIHSVYNRYNLKMIIKFGEKMAETKYKTKQRDEILGFFRENADGCFTAREVIEKVRAGEATVFRTLSALVDEGVLKRFTGDSSRGGAAHYQYNMCTESEPHIHLKCEDCGRLIHMDCGFMNNIVSHFRADHGFAVDCTRTVIYGRCEACAGKGGHDAK